MYEIIRIISSRCKQQPCPALRLECGEHDLGSSNIKEAMSTVAFPPAPPILYFLLFIIHLLRTSTTTPLAALVCIHTYIHTRVHSIRPCTTYGGVPQAILYITAGTHPHAALLLFSLCCLLARPPSLNYLLHPSSACAAAPKNSTFKSTDGSDCCCCPW